MKSIEAIANKFKSGNSIPCEFARVYLAEWEAIVAEVDRLEKWCALLERETDPNSFSRLAAELENPEAMGASAND